MKTDKKTMAEVFRKIADNLDNGLDEREGIQSAFKLDHGQMKEWEDKSHKGIDEKAFRYRVKPETITLKNGVTIPKPLDIDLVDDDKFYYYPCVDRDYFDRANGRRIKDSGTIIFYSSMEEAREVGKALFGIED